LVRVYSFSYYPEKKQPRRDWLCVAWLDATRVPRAKTPSASEFFETANILFDPAERRLAQ